MKLKWLTLDFAIFFIAYVNTALQRFIISKYQMRICARVKLSCRSKNHETAIQSTKRLVGFSVIFGLKGLKMRHFRPYHDQGN